VPRRFQNVVQNFGAGVLSPRYAAAVDSEAFAHSLEQATNFIVSSQGGLVFREGMQFIGNAISNQPFRIFQFHRGGDISDILIEVSEGNIRYWTDTTGQPELIVDNVSILLDEDTGSLPLDFLVDEDTGDFLTLGIIVSDNPYSLEDLDTIYFSNQGKYGVLCQERHPPYYITSRADGTILTEVLDLIRIPEFIYNDVNSPRIESEKNDWRISFPASWASNSLVYIATYNGVASAETYNFNPNDDAGGIEDNRSNLSLALNNAASRQGFTTTFVVVSVDLRTYEVDVQGENSGWDVVIAPIYGYAFIPLTLPPIAQPINDGNQDQVAEPAWSYPLMVLHGADDHYYQCIRTHRSVAAVDEPGVGTAWELFWTDLGIAIPDGWFYQYPAGNSWADDTVYSPLNRGFPTVCVFHEQRLILMANKDNPTAIYGSAIGDFFSFRPGPNDDQPFLYVIDSSDTPEIKWARSQRSLLLGTSSGEWSINAAVTITPTDINAEQQNYAKSDLTLTTQVDTEIFYIEQGGRKLRATRFVQDNSNTFTSDQVSLMAEDLVSTYGISRVVGSHIPETMLTMLRKNGQVVYLTYEKQASVLAFTEGETDGSVADVASFFSLPQNADYTYYAVQRNNRYVLERMRYPCSKLCTGLQAQGVVHMDGWTSGIVTGSIIEGLENLEGKTVFVLVDDAWQIGTYVVINGQVLLNADETGKTYAVGLPYTGTAKTYEINAGVEVTALGTQRRWNSLTTRILNSALPKVYGEIAADRRPSVPMGTSDNVIDGVHDVEQTVAGYTDGSITIIQDRPYPLYMMAFFGEYKAED
jgi:hypothetical protein